MKTIIMTKQEYTIPHNRKTFPKKPDSIETSTISLEEYKNITSEDTIKFFRRIGGSETVIRGYTSQGYNVVELISKNPSKDTKIIRTFNFDSEV